MNRAAGEPSGAHPSSSVIGSSGAPIAFHLDADEIARFEEDLRIAEDPDATRRAGDDDVARIQRELPG